MDLSFTCGQEKFNYRVCGLIISECRILAMRDERSPYYYLPGGRVQMGETAEDAVRRELREELAIEAEIVRPLWLNQCFFTKDVDHLRYHELCVYFLMDASRTGLFARGGRFAGAEQHHRQVFEWLAFEQLKELYFYPLFLKEKIFELPDSLTLLATYE